jgi:hypothetical protein
LSTVVEEYARSGLKISRPFKMSVLSFERIKLAIVTANNHYAP